VGLVYSPKSYACIQLNKARQLLKKRDDISSSKVGGIQLLFVPELNDFLFSTIRWTPSTASAAACRGGHPQVYSCHFNADDHTHFDAILPPTGNLINYPFLCYVTEHALLTASDFDSYCHLFSYLLAAAAYRWKTGQPVGRPKALIFYRLIVPVPESPLQEPPDML
jgi:hypothetical protein